MDYYKSVEKFENSLTEICYIPENVDNCYSPPDDFSGYCKQDFLNLCNGNEDAANCLFYGCDWQFPTTLFDEYIREGLFDYCINCHELYVIKDEDNIKCSVCGCTEQE